MHDTDMLAELDKQFEELSAIGKLKATMLLELTLIRVMSQDKSVPAARFLDYANAFINYATTSAAAITLRDLHGLIGKAMNEKVIPKTGEGFESMYVTWNDMQWEEVSTQCDRLRNIRDALFHDYMPDAQVNEVKGEF